METTDQPAQPSETSATRALLAVIRPAEACFVVTEVAWPSPAAEAAGEYDDSPVSNDVVDHSPAPGAPVNESEDDLTATAARQAVLVDTGDHESVEDDDLLELSGGPGIRGDEAPPATIPMPPRRETPLAPVPGVITSARPVATASLGRVEFGAPPPLPPRATRSTSSVETVSSSPLRASAHARGRALETNHAAELSPARRAFKGGRDAARWYGASQDGRAPQDDDFARLMMAVVSGDEVDENVRRTTTDWFSEVFEETWVRLLPAEYPGRCRREAAFAAESLRLAHGAQVLDVGCGVGLHAIDLAARGAQVTGFDLSRVLLEVAAAEARRHNIGVRFAQGDMRLVSFEAQFDAVTLFGQTFGYFSDAENFATLQGLVRALKPGGRIYLDLLNRDWLVQRVPRKNWWDPPGLIVMEDVEYDTRTGRLLALRTIVDGDKPPWEQHMSTRVYALHELVAMCDMVGLRVLEVSGSIAQRGAHLGACDRWTIVTAERVR